MGLTDQMAEFINQLIEQAEGAVIIRRSDLADRFNCVPSQVNYVLTTRFAPENGFIVESRRGSGGIRITRISTPAESLIAHVVGGIGDELGALGANNIVVNLARAGCISQRDASLCLTAVSDNVCGMIPQPLRDRTRARLLKAMLLRLA